MVGLGVGAGMIARRLIVRAPDVAHDGLAHVFAEHGGDLVVAAAAEREAELDELVRDLAEELGGIVSTTEGGGG